MNEQPGSVTITLDKKTLSGFVTGFLVATVIFGGIMIVQGKWSLGKNNNVAYTPPTAVTPPAGQPATINNRPVDAKTDHIRGSNSAEITLLEYSDLECPFCKRFHPTLQQIMTDYKGKVRWVYRHFPLAQLHSRAPKEAEASECVAKLGGEDAFWKYIDKIYEVTPGNNGLDPAQLPIMAGNLGINVAAFQKCLDSGEMTAKVAADEQDALNAGGQGTPYSILITKDGKKVPISGALPIEQVKQQIDSLL